MPDTTVPNPPPGDPRLAAVAARVNGLRVALDRADDAVDLLDRDQRVAAARHTTRIRGEVDVLADVIVRLGAGLTARGRAVATRQRSRSRIALRVEATHDGDPMALGEHLAVEVAAVAALWGVDVDGYQVTGAEVVVAGDEVSRSMSSIGGAL